MTRVYNDTVEVDLQIGGLPWKLIEAEIELSRMDVPDYVDMRVIPDPDRTAPAVPTTPNIDDLVGETFTLDVDNELISERDTDADEVTRLFTGNLANISPTGRRDYEAIAYNPIHQPFSQSENRASSIMNQTFRLRNASVVREFQGISQEAVDSFKDGLTTQEAKQVAEEVGSSYQQTFQVKADKLLRRILFDIIGLPESKVNIMLSEDGQTIDGESGTYSGAKNRNLVFQSREISVGEALLKIKRRTNSEWWFDRFGVFNFGIPEPAKHELSLITDADAGKTTPPYQSIRVVGSGAASQEDWSRANQNIADKIVVRAKIGVQAEQDENQSGGEFTAVFEDDPSAQSSGEDFLVDPVFEYVNAEISTEEQARSVADNIAKELGEQQADGKVTVVGFPEIRPLDGIVMPQSTDENAANFNINQPMGGARYQVYKVKHKLNNSDGFLTEVNVAAPTGAARTKVFESVPKQGGDARLRREAEKIEQKQRRGDEFAGPGLGGEVI